MLHDDNVSVDNKFDTFYENLSALVDKHAPVRKMTRKEVRLHRTSHITNHAHLPSVTAQILTKIILLTIIHP